MYNETNQQLMMVIFDGIDNSVFKSQVLIPLLKQIDVQKNIEVTLVSFERKEYTNQALINIIPPHDRLHVILCPRTPFIGTLGLSIAKYYFTKVIQNIPLQKIIARGPLAGWIVLQFIKKLYQQNHEHEIIDITIQARGLAAEEYRFACSHKSNSWYHRLFQNWYYHALQNIEYDVYRNDRFKKKYKSIEIESVSEALKEYLIEEFEAAENNVFIAERDLISPLTQEEKNEWHTKTRTKLNIPLNAIVYCYSGSAKPWQCLEETILSMQKKLLSDPNIWFLLLMPQNDHIIAQKLLNKYIDDQKKVLLTSVVPAHLLRYLAAANYGILLREKDIVNWTSRPTKFLEYQAAGLTIIHNNTVKYAQNHT